MTRRQEDLTGESYGKLTVIKFVEFRNHARWWLCQCDCGNTTELRTSELGGGRYKSCGCMRGKGMQLPKGEAAFNAIFSKYKISAKDRERTFELTKEEFKEIINQNCHYCNAEPVEGYTPAVFSSGYLHNGIDRIDNTVGYIKENCVPCCKRCNYIKWNMTQTEFLDHIRKIHENIVKEEQEVVLNNIVLF